MEVMRQPSSGHCCVFPIIIRETQRHWLTQTFRSNIRDMNKREYLSYSQMHKCCKNAWIQRLLLIRSVVKCKTKTDFNFCERNLNECLLEEISPANLTRPAGFSLVFSFFLVLILFSFVFFFLKKKKVV